MKKQNHEGPHKYIKAIFKTSGTTIFRCSLPSCPHFVYEPLIIGKISICNRCSNNYIITAKSIRAKKMHCDDCSRGRFNKVKEKPTLGIEIDREIDNLLDQIEGERSEG